MNEALESQIQLSPTLTERLDGRDVLLTGGTGFFGKWLLMALRRTAARVLLLSRSPETFQDANPELLWPSLDFIKGDIRDFRVPRGRAFDYVIHGATPVDEKLDRENPHEMRSIIIDGTQNLLSELRGGSPDCKVLFISSGAVYSHQTDAALGISESHACIPATAYGKGKLDAERMVLASSLTGVIGRCFAFVGPYLPLDSPFAAANFLRDALAGCSIVVRGDGKAIRSYMYTADLAEWLVALLVQGAEGEIYNVGSPLPVAIADLAREVALLQGSNSSVSILGLATPGGAASPQYVPDVSKAGRDLGLSCRVSLCEALQRTLDWHLGRCDKRSGGRN